MSITALLALSGTLPDAAALHAMRAAHGALVAADGAALELLALGLRPDVVIGDLDSIGAARASLEQAGTVVVEEPSQESNDFEKALVWLRDDGCRSVTVVGIDGGMLDHTLNNFSVLARFASTMALEVRTGRSHGRCVVDRLELACRSGDRVSLIPLPSVRLTTTGLAWELRDETLAVGAREGASNRALGDEVTLTVHDGVVLVVHYPAAGPR